MSRCKLCDSEFYQMETHVRQLHGFSSLKEYVIAVEYGGIPPKCGCGFCDELPNFYRGKFLKYANAEHSSFAYRQRCYIEKFGEPKCMQCGKPVGFRRAEPNKFCSFQCSGNNTGFSLSKTQEKISDVVKERYGVANIFQVKEVVAKIQETKRRNPKSRKVVTEDTRDKMSKATKRMWATDRKKMISSITSAINGSVQEINRRRDMMRVLRQTPSFIHNMIRGMRWRFSKLHIEIRKKLDLNSLGFVGEQRLGNYVVDELNENKKVVIEINGDYVHANPRIYAAKDEIKLRGSHYTAESKWNNDAKKQTDLEALGYRVIVLWESDTEEEMREKLQEALA